jgi:hypothetical protein
MRHGLDLVDLQNPKVRRPPVRLEQLIMIGTEMTRYTLTMNRRAEQATEVGAGDSAACTPMPTRRRVNWSMTTSTR